MSDSTKAVNPFLDRIPIELQEQYISDCVTELMKLKMAEKNNNTEDGVISFKYGLMVAFARKTWKLQPSIGHHVQIWPISEARLENNTSYNPRKHRTQNCAHSSCLEKERLHAYTKQCTESRVNIYGYIFVSNYYSHTSSNWNRRCWVGYGRQCMCRGLHIFMEK